MTCIIAFWIGCLEKNERGIETNLPGIDLGRLLQLLELLRFVISLFGSPVSSDTNPAYFPTVFLQCKCPNSVSSCYLASKDVIYVSLW